MQKDNLSHSARKWPYCEVESKSRYCSKRSSPKVDTEGTFKSEGRGTPTDHLVTKGTCSVAGKSKVNAGTTTPVSHGAVVNCKQIC